MKTFSDQHDALIKTSIQGLCLAHSALLELYESPLFVARHSECMSTRKVALVSGGGSGHEPLHVGLIGKGMLDAACPGELLTSPTPNQIAAAINHVDNGAGVLLLVKNYQGDRMNFQLAKRLIKTPVEMVLIRDDVAFDNKQDARGLAGTLVIEKMVGAAAERGMALGELKTLAELLVANTHSLGVSLSSLLLPSDGDVSCSLPSGKMEYGVGIHGEKGMQLIDQPNLPQLCTKMLDRLILNLSDPKKNLLLFVNGLGGTAYVELYAIYAKLREQLETEGFQIARSLVGNYVTSMSVNGFSITLVELDDQSTELWDAPVNTPHLRW